MEAVNSLVDLAEIRAERFDRELILFAAFDGALPAVDRSYRPADADACCQVFLHQSIRQRLRGLPRADSRQN